MKELMTKACKTWLIALAVGLFFGGWLGSITERGKFYGDCRYAGVTRIGEAAFKCEQFSKIVLLTPDEQAKKVEKK